MKKAFALIFALCLVLMCVGCSQPPEETGHQEHEISMWKNANCMAPKTCQICGYTEGEKGDHSTKLGTCEYCKEFQNQEDYDSIFDAVTDLALGMMPAYNCLNDTFGNLTSDTDRLSAAVTAAESLYFAENKTNLENLIAQCGAYTELEDTKAYLEAALASYPQVSGPLDLAQCSQYYFDAQGCYMNALEAMQAITQID